MKPWLAPLVLVLVAACGNEKPAAPKQKTLEDLKPVWGNKVKAKLDKVIAAASAASAADLGAPGDAPLTLDFDWDDAKAHPNAIAAQIDDVQSATELRAVPEPQTADEAWNAAAEGKPIEIKPPSEQHGRFTFQDDGKNHVFKAKALLGVPNTGGQYPEYIYDQFVNAKYVLVVMPGDLQWAVAEGSTFQSGSAPMRAILVEIDTAKPLGGFETTAQSSDKVKVTETKSGTNTRDKLDKDLQGAAGKAIVDGIQQRWPGAKTPYDWGFGW